MLAILRLVAVTSSNSGFSLYILFHACEVSDDYDITPTRLFLPCRRAR